MQHKVPRQTIEEIRNQENISEAWVISILGKIIASSPDHAMPDCIKEYLPEWEPRVKSPSNKVLYQIFTGQLPLAKASRHDQARYHAVVGCYTPTRRKYERDLNIHLAIQKAKGTAKLKDVLEATIAHLGELADAWMTGALDEHDGKGGTRSNRNVEIIELLRAIK